MAQTYIIQCWYGAATYVEAARKEINKGHDPSQYGCDFFRVGCKQLTTAFRYLKKWRRQAKDKYGDSCIFATLTRNDAHFAIEATPDGYHSTGVVASGMMKEFDD